MIKILVDSYSESKADCPFCGSDNNTCGLRTGVLTLKGEFSGNICGYKVVPECCVGFNENEKFDKEKCGMLKDIREYTYEESLKKDKMRVRKGLR